MAQSKLISLRQGKSYVRLVVVLLLVVFAGKFVIHDALPYFGFDKQTFGRYWNVKWSLIGHISCGIIALVIGPFQFWKTFRNRYLTTHRWMGRIYLTAILIGAACSTYLAWTSGIQVNFSWALGLQALAFAWITTAGMAYISVMRGRIQQHKEWMIRSYVITFAFVTFRFLSDAPIVISLMPKFSERGPAIIWLSWAIPLFITEIALSWKKK
jgi:Predicted membrane protein (DUF2306)